MRRILAALCGIGMFLFVVPAYAYWVSDAANGGAEQGAHHGRGKYFFARHSGVRHVAVHRAAYTRVSRAGMSVWGDCAEAAREGGPCGCMAMKIVGLVDKQFWAVSAWLRAFPRTSPHVGAAAVWPGRHVEIVSAVNGDGTVSTKGSIGFSHIPISRLIFVEAH